MIQRVAAEHDQGRHLYVATVNIDYKQVWVWDLTRLAREGGEGALERYRSSLHAAPSAPVAFPPVELDGSLFVDAGTRSNLLLAGLMSRVSASIEELERGAFGNSAAVNHARVYVILDGRIGLRPRAPSRSLEQLAGGAVAMMMDSSSEASIFQAFIVARLQGYDFNFVQIPDEFALKGSLAFDHAEILRLHEPGHALGSSPDAWSHLPPQSELISGWLLEALNSSLSPAN